MRSKKGKKQAARWSSRWSDMCTSMWSGMRRSVDVGDVAVFAMMTIHVVVCPYTKVEESFNMQAMYDIVHHGTNISAYDHVEFPGVVPRSFLGPLAVQAFLSPITLLQRTVTDESKFNGQVRGRLALGVLVLLALMRYKAAVAAVLGASVATCMMLITATQFHFLFYMSRPLPNVFALVIVLLVIQTWIEQKHVQFLWLSALVCVVFRTELILLLAPMLLIEVYHGRTSVRRSLLHAILAGTVCLAVTVLVDSCFWQRWLWPEGEVFYFNAILNKSGEYGTSPYLWYVYSVLPRCLLTSILFIPEALRVEPRTRVLLAPIVCFIALFSILPHKELRFIIYVVPVLNTLVAVACVRLWRNRAKSWVHTVVAMAAVGHVMVNVLFCAGFMYISHYNYPGGDVIKQLHEIEPKHTEVNVHLDVFVCQTGVTRFTQLNDNWRYNKTEELTPGGADLMSFTHLLVGVTHDMHEIDVYNSTHALIAAAVGFTRVQLNGLEGLARLKPLHIVLEPKAVLLKKIET